MNVLSGTVMQVTSSENMMLVDLDIGYGVRMISVILDTSRSVGYLDASVEIDVLFNESEVAIGRVRHGDISMNNQFPCVIEDVVEGDILSRIQLSFHGQPLAALITTRSAQRLQLRTGEIVTAFIKATEVLLKERDRQEEDAD